MSGTAARFLEVWLDAGECPAPGLTDFYAGRLGLPVGEAESGTAAVQIGETVLGFRPSRGTPFYHVALLVPGDRFEAAFAWIAGRVELLPDTETGEVVFDFTNWDAKAVYFHDPAGSIVELIAHHGIGESATTGPFSPAELLGVSEVGVVCDPRPLAEALRAELGLELWDGTVEGEGRLAFVGDKARTLILAREGRPWLPTGRPAEAHPVEIVLAGASAGAVSVAAGGAVRRSDSM